MRVHQTYLFRINARHVHGHVHGSCGAPCLGMWGYQIMGVVWFTAMLTAAITPKNTKIT